MQPGIPIRALMAIILLVCGVPVWAADNKPIKPTGADGKPLNFDFETGNLKDWSATGDAFEGQPIKGDAVYPRRHDMHSNHQGQYWIGGFEVKGDDATGTLTSVPFKVTHPWASFLVAGGPWIETRVDLLDGNTRQPFFSASGYESETLRPVVVDLHERVGKEILIRLVDERKGHWGHINFDDFAFYDQRPQFADELDPSKLTASQPPLDQFPYAGVTPEKAPQIMTLPEGFKATLFAGEPDIVQPIAFTIDQRGRLWVVQGMTYPRRQPEGQGQDSIIIFEDTKGTGHFDKRTVFMEHLDLVSGIEVGFGGVWVGAAPYLMFIPVTDWDNPKPASQPRILLDGWAYDDTHETLNTFCWGPDGWLYGCHGVFTQSNVGKPGAPPNERVHINAGIWRYHPTRHVFERFAEGTSNPWGIDFDQKGQVIIEACVIPHLWHIIQGGHYQRQAGHHDNPYVFDDIKTIADHLHWVGDKGPHAANGRSDAAGGGHAHAGMLVYQGGFWPEQYKGVYLMNNIHGARINMDVPEPKGSGYVGHHGKDFILFNDLWSQIINLRSDQDGSIFMIDWYDKNQCHNPDPAVHDRTNGRIFKISYGQPRATQVNLDSLTDADLVTLELDKNDWYVRTARRVLQERADSGKLGEGARVALLDILNKNPDEMQALRALWALHVTGGVPEDVALAQLRRNDKPYLQAWTMQLLCENRNPPKAAIDEFARLARESVSPVVRLYVAAAAQRTPLDQTWDMVGGLLSHAEDANDHNLPLMDWYALEPLAGKEPSRAMALAMQTKLPNILVFAVRRIAAVGSDSALAALTDSLGRLSDEPRQLDILQGINEALRGRRNVAMPKGWGPIEEKLLSGGSDAIKTQVAALSVTFGSRRAIEYERSVLSDSSAAPAKRRAAIDALTSIKDPRLPATLQKLIADPAVRAPALRALGNFEDAITPKSILSAYPSFNVSEKKDALNTLASRAAYAAVLLAAVGSGTVAPNDVSADIVRQLRNLHDPGIDAQAARVWGVLRDSPQDKLNRIAEIQKIVEGYGTPPDLVHGRQLFTATCSQCHSLFDTGGHVGPDITGSNRADLHYLLENVVDPNAVIPNDYRQTILQTTDGRMLAGIVKKEDSQAVTLQTTNELLIIPRNEVKVQKLSPISMMPEGLLDQFAAKDLRDLIAYLRSPTQVPLPQSASGAQPVQKLSTAGEPADSVAGPFFNGKDLTGWYGDKDLWKVEDGQIVGKTDTGLKHNEFLKTRKSFGDFHLVVKIKLVPNEANSGIQFHSEPFEGYEMKGPQADAGKGWWGKLYEENGRGIISDKSGEPFLKPNEWNTYEVLAVGSKVRTAINGHLCVDLDDPKISQRGIFGLQVHAGGPTEVRFKDFDFAENPKFEMKTLAKD